MFDNSDDEYALGIIDDANYNRSPEPQLTNRRHKSCNAIPAAHTHNHTQPFITTAWFVHAMDVDAA